MSYIPLENVVYFKVLCGDPANAGKRVAADFNPTFNVYKTNGSTVIATGSMSAFASETGAYSGYFTAAATAGFEQGKCHTIVADAIIGGNHYGCMIEFWVDYPTLDITTQAATNMNLFFDNDNASTGYTVDDLGSASGLTQAGVRTAIGLATANLDTQLAAIPAANATALLDGVDAVEAGLPVRKFFRMVAAVLGGKLSGAGTTTESYRNAVADSKTRVAATVDSSGNRTAITTDLS